jgi:hypothetical protein
LIIRQIFQSYGLTYPQPRGTYRLDHLIPLGLGGSNDVKNLWPEADFAEKDKESNWLHKEVCEGRMTLQEAQERMRKWGR